MAKKRITVNSPEPLLAQLLNEAAQRRGISRAALMRLIIHDALQNGTVTKPTKIHLDLPDELHGRLLDVAGEVGMPLSTFVRAACWNFVWDEAGGGSGL